MCCTYIYIFFYLYLSFPFLSLSLSITHTYMNHKIYIHVASICTYMYIHATIRNVHTYIISLFLFLLSIPFLLSFSFLLSLSLLLSLLPSVFPSFFLTTVPVCDCTVVCTHIEHVDSTETTKTLFRIWAADRGDDDSKIPKSERRDQPS